MNEMYVSPTLDEKVVIRDAKEKSRRFGPYRVHYHPEAIQCEAKYRHRMFVDGNEHILNQSGQA